MTFEWLQWLAPAIAILAGIAAILFGALGLRHRRSRDLLEELRECEGDRTRLRGENVDLMRRLILHEQHRPLDDP